MNKKVSVVIRNKNEGPALEKVLKILNNVYMQDIEEIIVVDNNSTDRSLEIAWDFDCKIVPIQNFSYGRAINLGIEKAKSTYILLLSSHAIPIGKHFFKNSISAIETSRDIAGIRYINSIDNYNRAVNNNFFVTEPLKYGLMAACCLVNRKVWEQHKFNEDMVFSEDKEWSQRVVKDGYQLLDFNETFFYFIKRDNKSLLKRFKNETIFEYQIQNKQYPGPVKPYLSFLKKNLYANPKNYFKIIKQDFLILKTKLEIYKTLKKK